MIIELCCERCPGDGHFGNEPFPRQKINSVLLDAVQLIVFRSAWVCLDTGPFLTTRGEADYLRSMSCNNQPHCWCCQRMGLHGDSVNLSP